MKNSIAALVPLIALGFAANSANAKDPALLSLTMEHFRDTATVKDDPVDAITTISTENGYAEHTGPMRMVWNDEYLTSAIDKKTGQKSFQVYAWTIYSGRLRSYESVNYQTPTGPKSVPAIQIGKETANCAVGDCLYTERVAFPVDEDLLRQLAAGNVSGKPTIWAYRLTAKSGPDYAGGLSSAEIAGLLAKIDEFTNALPVRCTKVRHHHRGHSLRIRWPSGEVARRAGSRRGGVRREFDRCDQAVSGYQRHGGEC